MTEPASSDPEELREQIEHTRDELSETVQALAGKADVKTRAKGKASELTAQAKDYGVHAKAVAAQETQVAREQVLKTHSEKPWLFPAAGGAAVLGLVLTIVLRRRRS